MDEEEILEDWIACDEQSASNLEAELKREVTKGHQLYLLELRAVAFHVVEVDDVLFQIIGADRFWIVHLTYKARETPPYPYIGFEGNWQEFQAYAKQAID